MTCADGTTLYNYDAFGNLRHITLPSGTAIDYIIRWAKPPHREEGQRHAGRELPLPEPAPATAWLDGTGAVKATFVYGLHANVPEYIVQGGTTYRLITDHVGGVRLVENTSTGALAERIDYDEFGNVLNDTAPGTQPFGFAGGLRDLDAGLTRFGVRDYNPVTGRWTTTDPLKFGGGLVQRARSVSPYLRRCAVCAKRSQIAATMLPRGPTLGVFCQRAPSLISRNAPFSHLGIGGAYFPLWPFL